MSDGIPNLPLTNAPQGGLVPGAPSAQAPALSAPTVDTSNVDELTKQILQGLKEQHQKSIVAYRPVAPQIPGEQQYWKPQMRGPTPGVNSLAHNAAAALANLGRASLEKRVQKAEADWETLITAVQTNNKPLLDSVLNNNKALKNMSKVFQIDWLAPHKQTPHSIALNRVMQRQGQMQQAHKAGLMATIAHALGMKQNLDAARTPPFLPGQTGETNAQRIMKTLPIEHPPVDLKTLGELASVRQRMDAAEQQHLDRMVQHVDTLNLEKQRAAQQYLEFTMNLQSRQMAEQDRVAMEKSSQEAMNQYRSLELQMQHERLQLQKLTASDHIRQLRDSESGKLTPAQINTVLNSTLTTLRQQLTQSITQLRQSQQSSGVGRWWHGLQDPAQIQASAASTKGAIDFLERHRALLISGKADLNETIDQAYDMTMPKAGADSGAGIPGFVPRK